MSRFYGLLHGDLRPTVTRRGHRSLETVAASWRGAVRTYLYIGPDGRDWARVEIGTWKGNGPDPSILLFEGAITGGKEDA